MRIWHHKPSAADPARRLVTVISSNRSSHDLTHPITCPPDARINCVGCRRRPRQSPALPRARMRLQQPTQATSEVGMEAETQSDRDASDEMAGPMLRIPPCSFEQSLYCAFASFSHWRSAVISCSPPRSDGNSGPLLPFMLPCKFCVEHSPPTLSIMSSVGP